MVLRILQRAGLLLFGRRRRGLGSRVGIGDNSCTDIDVSGTSRSSRARRSASPLFERAFEELTAA